MTFELDNIGLYDIIGHSFKYMFGRFFLSKYVCFLKRKGKIPHIMKHITILKKIVVTLFLLAILVAPAKVHANILADASIGSPSPMVIEGGDISKDELELTSLPEETHLELSSFYSFPVTSENFYGISTKYSFVHKGIDYRAKTGSDVFTIHDGVVSLVDYEGGGYGKYIIVKHDNGVESLYAHLSKVTVKVGDSVNTGTVIGQIGLTGRTTGAHLHFELRANGRQINPSKIIPEVK